MVFCTQNRGRKKRYVSVCACVLKSDIIPSTCTKKERKKKIDHQLFLPTSCKEKNGFSKRTRRLAGERNAIFKKDEGAKKRSQERNFLCIRSCSSHPCARESETERKFMQFSSLAGDVLLYLGVGVPSWDLIFPRHKFFNSECVCSCLLLAAPNTHPYPSILYLATGSFYNLHVRRQGTITN